MSGSLPPWGQVGRNALFFAGDLGQRIFQQPFSWKALGVDIRGRSRTLRVNYRTSHQIRTQADRLLGPVVTDVDGNSEDRSDTVSVFNGPPPAVRSLKSESEETKLVGNWIAERAKAGVLPHEFGVFVRSAAQLDRARAAVKEAGLAFKILDEHVETTSGHVSISTMHLAKGLEFRAVVVMACDDEIIPLQERIETVGDDADLQEVYDTERHLLYVACTRARDHLLVSGVDPVSEFLDDFVKGDRRSCRAWMKWIGGFLMRMAFSAVFNAILCRSFHPPAQCLADLGVRSNPCVRAPILSRQLSEAELSDSTRPTVHLGKRRGPITTRALLRACRAGPGSDCQSSTLLGVLNFRLANTNEPQMSS